jgi:hypothetical protein
MAPDLDPTMFAPHVVCCRLTPWLALRNTQCAEFAQSGSKTLAKKYNDVVLDVIQAHMKTCCVLVSSTQPLIGVGGPFLKVFRLLLSTGVQFLALENPDLRPNNSGKG